MKREHSSRGEKDTENHKNIETVTHFLFLFLSVEMQLSYTQKHVKNTHIERETDDGRGLSSWSNLIRFLSPFPSRIDSLFLSSTLRLLYSSFGVHFLSPFKNVSLSFSFPILFRHAEFSF